LSGASDAVVLVTARSFATVAGQREELEAAVREVRWNEFGRPLTAPELREALAGVDGVIAGVDRFDAEVVGSADRLRVIARQGVGTDGIDLQAAAARGIVVTNTPGANADAVAELALGLMLALARRIPAADRLVRSGGYRSLGGIQLGGRTVGLLGVGRTGSALAWRARALECEVIGFDPARDDDELRSSGVSPTSRDRVIAEADFLSLHVPVTAETRDMVDAEFLARMKPGAYLVNTARGALVVEADLAAALDDGRLAGAGLDATRDEPPRPDSPLLGRDDVIVTPHSGADTEEARAAMGRSALHDLLAVLEGRPPRHPVELSAEPSHG
jgi:D-3-phosphoglycerate dehydrogenase / 2-oxoglutarate reductase